jgi:transcription-repair coupling factor (superfamily II helicase)
VRYLFKVAAIKAIAAAPMSRRSMPAEGRGDRVPRQQLCPADRLVPSSASTARPPRCGPDMKVVFFQDWETPGGALARHHGDFAATRQPRGRSKKAA